MLERQAVVGPVGRTFKLSLSFIRYLKTNHTRPWHAANRCHKEVEQVGIVPGVRDDLVLRPQDLLAAHHSLGDSVLLLVQERCAEEPHCQLQQGRVALIPAVLTLLVVPVVDQQ